MIDFHILIHCIAFVQKKKRKPLTSTLTVELAIHFSGGSILEEIILQFSSEENLNSILSNVDTDNGKGVPGDRMQGTLKRPSRRFWVRFRIVEQIIKTLHTHSSKVRGRI